MTEKEIIEDLVKEFGEEHREEIEETFSSKNGRYSDWGESGSFRVDGEEYNWIVNENEAIRIAKKLVRQDAEEEPELFSRDFLINYLYLTPTDRGVIANDITDNLMEYIKEEIEDELETEDEEKIEDEVEKRTEKVYEDVYNRLENPVEYFVEDEGIYTLEELLKQPFITIDYNKLVDDAIEIDGWAHFLSTYDGSYDETDNGVVYFRE